MRFKWGIVDTFAFKGWNLIKNLHFKWRKISNQQKQTIISSWPQLIHYIIPQYFKNRNFFYLFMLDISFCSSCLYYDNSLPLYIRCEIYWKFMSKISVTLDLIKMKENKFYAENMLSSKWWVLWLKNWCVRNDMRVFGDWDQCDS